MKIHIVVLLVIFGIQVIPLFGQQPGPMNREAKERIESQRIAFITQKLKLTPDEATRFWPVYNQYRDGLQEMRDDFERPDLEFISEEESVKLLEKHLQQEQKRLELKRDLISKLKTVIPAKKILMLQQAEREFNHELLRRIQEHRKPQEE